MAGLNTWVHPLLAYTDITTTRHMPAHLMDTTDPITWKVEYLLALVPGSTDSMAVADITAAEGSMVAIVDSAAKVFMVADFEGARVFTVADSGAVQQAAIAAARAIISEVATVVADTMVAAIAAEVLAEAVDRMEAATGK